MNVMRRETKVLVSFETWQCSQCWNDLVLKPKIKMTLDFFFKSKTLNFCPKTISAEFVKTVQMSFGKD